jgi:hypothetical protein
MEIFERAACGPPLVFIQMEESEADREESRRLVRDLLACRRNCVQR